MNLIENLSSDVNVIASCSELDAFLFTEMHARDLQRIEIVYTKLTIIKLTTSQQFQATRERDHSKENTV